MDKIIVNEELLALFLEGKTTVEESAAILKASLYDTDISLLLDSAVSDGMLMSGGISQNPSVMSVSKRCRVRSLNLPVERLAATSDANDCVVKCEKYILYNRGYEADYQRLSDQAREKGWLEENGTPLFNIGRLLELDCLSVARRFGGTVEDIIRELDGGCSVIAALDGGRLREKNAHTTSVVDHAVVVLYIDVSGGYVEIYDPQSGAETDVCVLDDFMAAWELSRNFFVSVTERGLRPYIPHPEDVSHIELPEDSAAIADKLAENAHEIWAADRIIEAEKKGFDPYEGNPYMKPFQEMDAKKQKADYLTALNSIKLIILLGYSISRMDSGECPELKTNIRNADGKYVPNPIPLDGVTLPHELTALTEYIAENAHEEWAQERLKEGWTYAPMTNRDRMQHADLVPYCELIDSEKDYDRKMAMKTLSLLYVMGYKIEKKA